MLGCVCWLYMRALRVELLFVLFYLAVVCPCVSGKKYSLFPQEFCVTGLSRLDARRRLQSAAPPFFPASTLPVYRVTDRGSASAKY